MLPRRLRKPVGLIYSFARAADDFADEGDRTDEERILLLDSFRHELARLSGGQEPQSILFRELSPVMEQYRLPVVLFTDLLDAFTQDVCKKRYADFDELLDYCSKSANPVGRLLLHLYGINSEKNRQYSDNICSSLQLINFLQDIEIDFEMGRIYLPEDEMMRYGIAGSHIESKKADASWAIFMKFQAERARRMMLDGAPLAGEMKGRIALEMKLIILGGLRILEKLDKSGGNIFGKRPKLGRFDWALMLVRALCMRGAPHFGLDRQ